MYKINIYTFLFPLILLFSISATAQDGRDEPCNARVITPNPIGSECKTVIAGDVASATNNTFTNSTSATSGVNLPALNCDYFNVDMHDWWYKITVPASGYFSVKFSDNTPGTTYDWVMYTSSSTTCAGSVFTQINSTGQCSFDDFTAFDVSGVGPLTPGTVVYLRMWEEDPSYQDFEESYEICVNEVGAATTACTFPISPANNSTIGAFPAVLSWTPIANAAAYHVFIRDITAGGTFQDIGTVTETSVNVGGDLSYSTTYEWYALPVNSNGIVTPNCMNKFIFKTPAAPPAATCATATQICAPFSFSAGVNQPSDGGGANAEYDCLSTAPNPEYHWVRITQAGNIRWKIASTPDQDIDYAIWGPFTGVTPHNPTCGSSGVGSNGFLCGATLGNPIACDYTTANGGNATINGVKVGEYYMVLVTNYENTPAAVNITNRTNSTAGIECPCLISDLEITTNTDCNNNMYSINYNVSFNTAPTTGVLNISDGEGHIASIAAPFTSPNTGTINGLTADGAFHTFTASFSASGACSLCTNYTAPEPAPANNTCATGLTLSANASAGAATGYTNMCTGKSVGEATYCGSPACRSVFYKIHTSSVAVDRTLNIDFDGGNSGDQLGSCANGLRVTVLTDCNTLATVTPSSCQKVSTQTASLTFGDLALNTDYYIAVDQTNCTDESCNWSMRFLGIGVLPITMGSFEVIKMNTYNSLKWITVNEQKTDYFELLRSTDGVNYYSIGKLTASDIRNGSTYSFNDDNMPAGINYYKIKTVNKDGTFELSEIRKINNSSATFNLAVMPNPAKNDIKVVINNVEKGEGKFIITDGIGRKLAVKNVQLTTGKNEFKFDISTYSAGVLYIKFVDKTGVTVTQPINKLR